VTKSEKSFICPKCKGEYDCEYWLNDYCLCEKCDAKLLAFLKLYYPIKKI
jgi:hypothetical protein